MNLAVSFRLVLVLVCLLTHFNLQAGVSIAIKSEQNESKEHHQLANNLRKILAQISNNEPGFAVLLKHKNRTVLKSVRGMANKTEPVTENTGFRIGSVSKPFTALAIMQLVEKKELHLSDAVSEHIQELGDDWSKISIKDLLTHRVALPKDLFDDKYLNVADKATNRKLIEFLNQESNKPRLLEAKSARYCNSCYVLLAEIVSRVSQMSFAEYMNKRFFETYLMSNSYIFDGPTVFRKTSALNYAKTRSFLNIEQYTSGAMGQVSSLEDLSKFVRSLKSYKIVSEATLSMMTKNHVELDGGYYGFGWMIGEQDRPFFAHGGDQDGYQSELYFNPEFEIELIMLGNGGASSRQVQGKIIREVLTYFRELRGDETSVFLL